MFADLDLSDVICLFVVLVEMLGRDGHTSCMSVRLIELEELDLINNISPSFCR